MIGNVGARDQRSFSAIGDTTNVDARLQAAARPGHVLMSGAMRARIADSVRVEPLNALVLKGKDDPVEVCELTAVVER